MIYCVEDDAGVRNMMVYALNVGGFQARGFGDGASFFEALREEKPELVMLDIMLPGEDGVSILRRLKEQTATADIPVVMETAKGSEFDKVTGLDLGADDYLAKPFGMMEMLSRVKAVLRRCAPKAEARLFRAGDLTLNDADHTVTVAGSRVLLTLKEYDLLLLFMENPGRAYTRDQLLSIIWNADYMGETRTVDVHIASLRTKLGACGEMIETVRGVGYRMEGKA